MATLIEYPVNTFFKKLKENATCAMNSTDNLYCRFCAEPRSSEKMLNLQTDVRKQDEIVAKLTLLNAMFIDISNRDSLPKTICFVCYDSLNKAYDFFEGVKRAQSVLTTIFTQKDHSKNASDDETYDDFLCPGAVEDVPVKIEITPESEDVKQEPKEEKELDDYGISLNVDDILGAALCNTFTSNLTIYAKEVANVSEVAKKSVLSWTDYPWICAFCSFEFMGLDLLRYVCFTHHI